MRTEPDYELAPDGASEIDLLISCARASIGAERADGIRDRVDLPIDWEWVARQAARHQVEPLLRHGLRSAGCMQVAAEHLPGLEAHALDISVRNTYLVKELGRILRLLESQRISVICYKGPVTAGLAYGDIALREFQDLDLLVRLQDLSAVCAVLQSQGYRANHRLTPRQRQHAERVSKEYCLRLGPVLIEPHWSITAPRFPVQFDYDALWGRAEVTDICGVPMRVFSAEDRVLVQSITGGKSKWNRLRLVCDMAALLYSTPNLDWSVLFQRARAMGCERMLLLGLTLAARMLNAPVPEAVLARSEGDSNVRMLTSRIEGRLFCDLKPEGIMPRFPWRFSSLLMRMRERPSDQIRYLWRTLTTPRLKHVRRFPLPPWLSPLYVVIVPLHDYVLWPAGRLAMSLCSEHQRPQQAQNEP